MHAQTSIPAQSRKFSHPEYMHVARWMVGYCNRDNGQYTSILNKLRRSKLKAGGPALRLAQAVWDFHYRTLYPDDPKRRVEEENSFAHLRFHHMEDIDKRYFVWQAMEDFVKLRTYHYDDNLMPTITQPPLETPHPLRAALRHLDEKAMFTPAVRLHPLFKPVLEAIRLSNPTDDDILIAVTEAAEAYADWRLNTLSSEAFIRFQNQTNAVLHLRYRNQEYLENKNPQLLTAISLLGRCLRIPPS